MVRKNKPSSLTPKAVRPKPQHTGRKSQPVSAASWWAIPAFAAVYLVLALVRYVPFQVGLVYLGASLVCFMAYAFDKSAARAGRWRTSEQSLLVLGLVGGWPGAIAAQQLLRHKTAKPSFQTAFWATVLLNVAAFVALATSPSYGFPVLLR